MTQTIKIKESQTLVDVAMQYCGNAERVFDIAALNSGLSLTADLAIGTDIIIPDANIEDVKIVTAFADNGLIPASKDDAPESGLGGIGYMAVGLDFIVS